eukprot:4405636-Amphidinium_carterae.1
MMSRLSRELCWHASVWGSQGDQSTSYMKLRRTTEPHTRPNLKTTGLLTKNAFEQCSQKQGRNARTA